MKATFAGANIKGTPAMKASAVKHDLKVLREEADVFGVQEFKWPWYWRLIVAVLVGWGSYPGHAKGIKNPSDGAQAIFWKRALFRATKRYSIPAFNFGLNNAGIMDNRFIRAALLQSKTDNFKGWFLSTHFVVGGDSKDDEARRQNLMRSNIHQLNTALIHLRRTGYPIMGELDGNIRKETWAYREFMEMMEKHGAVFHGDKGIEFAFTIPGKKGKFKVLKARVIPTSKLKTDHEVRVLDFEGVVS